MRLPGWEERLSALVEAARTRPYAIGEWDCFRLACAVVAALTGTDPWPAWAGKYRTRREAMRLLASHGSTFEAAGDWFFAPYGSPPGSGRTGALWARRGDLCAVQDDAGEKHLGVCLGAETAFPSAQGFLFIRTAQCLCAWRIG